MHMFIENTNRDKFFSMRANSDPIFPNEETKFSRLTIDQLKQNDLRTLFETLMTEPTYRTIADINTLIKIMINLAPVKKLRNASVVYHLCRSMFIAKFKEKAFIYQRQEDAESIYIILNGKVGLYKRNPQSEQQEQVIFLAEGSSFGHAYKWKQKFLPLTFQQTLLAVIPKRQLVKIALKINQEQQDIVSALARAKIFGTVQMLRPISSSLNLHRVPYGNYLVKEGQIPKGLFFILKGTVSKQLSLNKSEQNSKEKQQLSVAEYSVGDYFPKQKLSEIMPFSIVAESPCEIVSIPKRCLKLLPWSPQNFEQFRGEQYYRSELAKQKEWKEYKQNYLQENLHFKSSKPKPMMF